MMGSARHPRVSVIVTLHDAGDSIESCLRALRSSTLSRSGWELIVVDDASRDGGDRLAEGLADFLIRLPGRPRGPAYARNRGFDAASGSLIVFVDPHIEVRADALEQLHAHFESHPETSAVTGCWDDDRTGSMLTDYLSLRRRFHQRPGDGSGFWAGLGAVRASVFREMGGFDEWLYPRASVEDVELGHRMRIAGHRVVRLGTVRGTCPARARLRTVLYDEVRTRVIPGTRLALHVGPEQDEPRSSRTRAAGALALAAVLMLLASPFLGSEASFRLAALFAGGFIIADADFLAHTARSHGTLFAVSAIPLHLVATVACAMGSTAGWLAHHLVGPPRVPLEILASASGEAPPVWPPVPVQPAASVWARPPRRPGKRRRVAA